jgi:hypothetical protein
MVKRTIAGACVVCGIAIAPPAAGGIHFGGAGVPLISASPVADQEGPHVPESPFTVHVPGAEYSGTAATTLMDSGAALDALRVDKTGGVPRLP